MGADNSANTCRRITETVRDAGINGITLPRDEVVILTINRQNNFTFQYSAYFLTLMLNSFPVVVPGWYVSKIIASVRFGLPL